MEQYGHHGGSYGYEDPAARRRRKLIMGGAAGGAAALGGYGIWRAFKQRGQGGVAQRGAYDIPQYKSGFFGAKKIPREQGIAQRADEIRHASKLSTRLDKFSNTLKRHRDRLTVKSGKPVGRWAAFRSLRRLGQSRAGRVARLIALRR